MRGLLDTMPTTLAGVREAMQNLGYDKASTSIPWSRPYARDSRDWASGLRPWFSDSWNEAV
jgi:hypothetical protein